MTTDEYVAQLELERPGSISDILMRAEHQRRVDVFYMRAREITPVEWEALMVESSAYTARPKYKPRRRGVPSREKQLQIAVQAAEKRIA